MTFNQIFCPNCKQLVEEIVEQAATTRFVNFVWNLVLCGILVFGVVFVLHKYEVHAAVTLAAGIGTFAMIYWFVLHRLVAHRL